MVNVKIMWNNAPDSRVVRRTTRDERGDPESPRASSRASIPRHVLGNYARIFGISSIERIGSPHKPDGRSERKITSEPGATRRQIEHTSREHRRATGRHAEWHWGDGIKGAEAEALRFVPHDVPHEIRSGRLGENKCTWTIILAEDKEVEDETWGTKCARERKHVTARYVVCGRARRGAGEFHPGAAARPDSVYRVRTFESRSRDPRERERWKPNLTRSGNEQRITANRSVPLDGWTAG